jgi:hypothetical protein
MVKNQNLIKPKSKSINYSQSFPNILKEKKGNFQFI